jgi:hypothetical protein
MELAPIAFHGRIWQNEYQERLSSTGGGGIAWNALGVRLQARVLGKH